MEIAEDAAASGGCRIRDLPPSKRFKFVGSSSRLGSAPCVPLPERAPLPVCLPPKKRAYAPAVAEDALKACLPAKKRAYAPPLDGIVPACLPAKKRVYVPPPLEDAAARPPVPAKKRVHPLLPPGGAAAAHAAPAKKRVHVPLPPVPEDAVVSPPIPLKKRVQPLLPPRGATAAPSAPAKKRIHVPLPPPSADLAASSVVAKKKVHPLMPPEAIAAPPSIPAKKRAQAPSPAEDDSGLAPVCLQANKRVMSPFICPSPSPSMESDGALVAAVKQPRSQRSVKRGGATDPRAAKGAVDGTRAEALKMPEKPIKPKEVQEQVSIKSCGASTAKESSDLHRKKLCDVVNGRQSEVQAEVLKKSEQVIDQVEAPAREEESNKEAEEVAPELEQEAIGEEEEDGVLCAVCGSTDGDPSDPIVFCDGCDLMVHASCYGSPLAQSIPEGDWFCSLCSDKATATVKKGGKPARPHCRLCPARGGAMKRTTDGAWAHIACALLVPEVFFQDPDGRDGIDCSRVPGHRYTKRCYICESSRGCALECSQPKCGLGFHVSCGLKGGLCIEYREEKVGAVVAGFCREHTKLWEKQQLTGKYKIVSRGRA